MNIFSKNKELFIALGIVGVSGVAYFAFGGRKGLMKVLRMTDGIIEKAGDTGWNDPKFQQEMADVGWHSGWAWCVLYSEYVWKKILPKYKYKVAEKLLTNNSQTTWANFKRHTENNGKYFEISKKPKKGSIAIWQGISNPLTGHAGIVTDVPKDKDYFVTQEGNYAGKVTKDIKRKYRWNGTTSEGYRLIGFINIK